MPMTFKVDCKTGACSRETS